MRGFNNDDFLLDTPVARRLYREVAADLPVIDYHSHLQQGEIATRKVFANIAELWLGGDHYKWRLMRTAGVDESLITGDQSDEAKVRAFCKALPLAAGNPIHHWCHLELKRLFGIELTINEANAGDIWPKPAPGSPRWTPGPSWSKPRSRSPARRTTRPSTTSWPGRR